MESKIVARASFTVVGLKYHGKNEQAEIPHLWQTLGPRMGEIQNMAPNAAGYGISANMDMATGEFDYVAGFEVADASQVPEGMVAFDVPGGKYAVFTTTLPRLGDTFHYVYSTWLPQSGHQHAGTPEFEMYGEGFDAQVPDSEFDLHIPIK